MCWIFLSLHTSAILYEKSQVDTVARNSHLNKYLLVLIVLNTEIGERTTVSVIANGTKLENLMTLFAVWQIYYGAYFLKLKKYLSKYKRTKLVLAFPKTDTNTVFL